MGEISNMKFLFILAVSAFITSCGKNSESMTHEEYQELELQSEYLNLVNAHRRDMGLRSLKYSKEIEEVAKGHSLNMALKKVFFGHSGWKNRCNEIRNYLGGNACSEIVAMGQQDTKAVFDAWLNSPSHRASIEDSRYTHTGLGFAVNSKGVIYWTQLFLDVGN